MYQIALRALFTSPTIWRRIPQLQTLLGKYKFGTHIAGMLATGSVFSLLDLLDDEVVVGSKETAKQFLAQVENLDDLKTAQTIFKPSSDIFSVLDSLHTILDSQEELVRRVLYEEAKEKVKYVKDMTKCRSNKEVFKFLECCTFITNLDQVTRAYVEDIDD